MMKSYRQAVETLSQYRFGELHIDAIKIVAELYQMPTGKVVDDIRHKRKAMRMVRKKDFVIGRAVGDARPVGERDGEPVYEVDVKLGGVG